VVDEELPAPTTSELQEALKIFQRHVDKTGNVEIRNLCDKMGDLFSEEQLKNLKQKKINEFFH
jgi:hypothetical protein